MALTGKQQAFVVAYLETLNATEAARRAGYPERSAYQRGYENMRRPEIAAAIEQHFAASAMTGSEVLALIAEQARAEYSEYLTATGVDLGRLLADRKGHLIKSIKPTRYGLNVEFHDPVAAREIIVRAHGLLERGKSEDEPQHTVQWTVDEWKSEQEKRRRQAADTVAMFDDDE